MIGDDVADPLEAREVRHEGDGGEDHEGGEGVGRAPPPLGDDEHQGQQQAGRELERDADAQRRAGGDGETPGEEEETQAAIESATAAS